MSTDPYADLTSEERQLLVERAARYARIEDRRDEEIVEAVSFRRGVDAFALPLASMREIRALRKLCKIPGASPIVPAVFHHRGEILSAHDLSAFLHGAPADSDPTFVLIVDIDGRRIALLADELLGVLLVASTSLVALPVTLGERAACFAGSVDGSVYVLKPTALFEVSSLARAF